MAVPSLRFYRVIIGVPFAFDPQLPFSYIQLIPTGVLSKDISLEIIRQYGQ